jgi:DNA-binding transcriptional MerR regulator
VFFNMTRHYRIGAFAELAGVSTKTLRFYDEIGLLRPSGVDPRTRYRFYVAEQLEELAAIIELKALGASLAEIRTLSKRNGVDRDWRKLLYDLKSVAERSIEQATRSLHWINGLLGEPEGAHRPIPVVIKRRRAVAIASVRSRLDSYGEIERLEQALLRSLPVAAVGDLRGVLWHGCADSGCLEGEPFVALRHRVPSRGCFDLGELPAATLACAYSASDDDSAEKAYRAIQRWTQDRGYRLVGPKREICHARLLEIQFPVEPA